MTDKTVPQSGHVVPSVFTRDMLDWLPWLEPVAADRMSERHALGPRVSAALEHVHMLVLHPRDAAPPSLQALLDAGWSTTDIVTLSQIAAFLSFQIRVVAGLRVLAGTL